MIEHPSPNWNSRPDGTVIDTVIIHYTGMQSGETALTRLCDETAEVSAHYLIEEDGRLFRLVAEEKRAWHAGVSHWRGMDNLNHNSIGIELVNPGHEFGYRAFPRKQINALIELLSGIHRRHNILPVNVIGHSDIAPDRKTDPGELFPWEQLYEAGFGIYSKLGGGDTKPIAQIGDNVSVVEEMRSQLKCLGYNVTNSKTFDETCVHIVKAFQAHWRPSCVSGVYDLGTKNVLDDIIEQANS